MENCPGLCYLSGAVLAPGEKQKHERLLSNSKQTKKRRLLLHYIFIIQTFSASSFAPTKAFSINCINWRITTPTT